MTREVPWTADEVETLRTLRARGVTIGQIAVALDRKLKSVSRKVERLGIRLPEGVRYIDVKRPRYHRWTDADDAIVRRLWAEGLSAREIAAHLPPDVNQHSVATRAREIGCERRTPGERKRLARAGRLGLTRTCDRGAATIPGFVQRRIAAMRDLNDRLRAEWGD